VFDPFEVVDFCFCPELLCGSSAVFAASLFLGISFSLCLSSVHNPSQPFPVCQVLFSISFFDSATSSAYAITCCFHYHIF
jgi:hypothetical protein